MGNGEGKGAREITDKGLGQNVSNVGPTCYQIAILFHTLHLEYLVNRNTHSYLFHRGIRASRLPFQLSSARRPRSASSLTLSISNPSNSKYHYQHHSTPLNPMALVRIYAHQHTSRTAGHE